jgi:hypothetical protein
VGVDETFEVLRLDGGIEYARKVDYVEYTLLRFEPEDQFSGPSTRLIYIYCHTEIDKFIKYEFDPYGYYGYYDDRLGGEWFEEWREVTRGRALALFAEYGVKVPDFVLRRRAAGTTPPTPGRGIDYEAVSAALLNSEKVKSSRLVKFMASRSVASQDDICDYVYEKDNKTWTAVKSLVNRTNNDLLDLEGPVGVMARRLKFKAAGHSVTKQVKPS